MSKVSIIMSVYKESAELVDVAVQSILNQSLKDIELIIVVDCLENKDVVDMLNKIEDKRITVLTNEKNLGLPLSLNKALRFASGEYIARMDADDISDTDRLRKQLKYLEDGGYDLVGCDVNLISNGKTIKTLFFPRRQENVLKYMNYASPVSHAAWIARRSVYKKNNGYRNIFSVEDLDFLIRCAFSGAKISNYDEPLYSVHMTESSISRANPGIQEALAVYLRRHYRKGVSPSMDDVSQYVDSIEYKRAVDRYKKYYAIKIKRSKVKRENILLYIIYTFLLALHLRTFMKDLNEKIHCRLILCRERGLVK